MIGKWLIVFGIVIVVGMVLGVLEVIKEEEEASEKVEEESEFPFISRVLESKLFKVLLFFFIKLPIVIMIGIIGITILILPFYFTGPVGGMIIWTCIIIIMRIL